MNSQRRGTSGTNCTITGFQASSHAATHRRVGGLSALLLMTLLAGCAMSPDYYRGAPGLVPSFMGGNSLAEFAEGHTLLVSIRVKSTDAAKRELPDWMAFQFGVLDAKANRGDLRAILGANESPQLVDGSWSRSGRDLRIDTGAMPPLYVSFRLPMAEAPDFVLGYLRIDREEGNWDASIDATTVDFDLGRGFRPQGELQVGPLLVPFWSTGDWRIWTVANPNGVSNLRFLSGDEQGLFNAIEIETARVKGIEGFVEQSEAEVRREVSLSGRATQDALIRRVPVADGRCLHVIKGTRDEPKTAFIAQHTCERKRGSLLLVTSVTLWERRNTTFTDFKQRAIGWLDGVRLAGAVSLHEAVEQGVAEAQGNLAAACCEGQGMARNPREAAR